MVHGKTVAENQTKKAREAMMARVPAVHASQKLLALFPAVPEVSLEVQVLKSTNQSAQWLCRVAQQTEICDREWQREQKQHGPLFKYFVRKGKKDPG